MNPTPAVFCGLAFLFPLAVYCLLLSMVNARRRPTLVSGPWDFAGVLLGTSGFLLVGGPIVLLGLNAYGRRGVVLGSFKDIRDLVSGGSPIWFALWVLYFLVVLAGAAYLIWRRRAVSVIYNIDPVMLENGLARALETLGLPWARVANRFFIGAIGTAGTVPPTAASLQVTSAPALARPGLPDTLTHPGSSLPSTYGPLLPAVQEREQGRIGELELDPFPAMRHVTLHWGEGDPSVRKDIEAELARVLADLEMTENPAAAWFLTAAGFLFLVMLLSLFALIFLPMIRR